MTNSKNTKRALLASILSVVLCCAMLIGSTFAWFTDSDSTAVNKIQAGTLDVQLVDAETGADLEGQTLNWKKAAGATAGEAVLWEPGCTYELPAVKIKNNGNLALKYKLVISGVEGNAKLLEAIEFTCNGLDINTEGRLKAKETSSALTIKGHMKETAGNEYQGLSIDGIGITVVATQDAVEYDSSDNQYDANAEYPVVVKNVDEFKNAITNGTGGTLLLTNPLHMSKQTDGDFTSGRTMVVDFNSQAITSNNGNIALRVKAGEVTLKNGTITAEKGDYCTVAASSSVANVENMTLNNCTPYGSSLKAFATGTINISDVHVNSIEGSGCVTAAGGIVNVYSGVFTQSGQYDHNSCLVSASNGGTANVYGGSFTGESYGLYVFNSGATINVYDGTFKAETVLKADKSTLDDKSVINVYGGSFDGKIVIADGAEMNIEAGTFTNTGLTLEQFKAFVAEGSTVMENNGTFVVTK